ncbi:MAG TPA: hypothetical protein VK674_05340 [Candidatus Limnocylindria bacterium]|nr:hypothetical protein [Candidatus Limnocylindria bacterium]
MAAKWRKKSKEVVGGSAPADKPARISNKLEHVLVAESKQQPRQRAKTLARRIVRHKRFKPAVIALVVIVALGSFAAYMGRDKKAPVVAPEGPKCTYRMLEKARLSLDASKVAKLEPAVGEIEQIPGYDQDPNCLFVVLTYYINISDAAKARELLNKLEKVYTPSEGYETVIVEQAKTPKELRPMVKFLEEEAARYKNIGPDGAPR